MYRNSAGCSVNDFKEAALPNKTEKLECFQSLEEMCGMGGLFIFDVRKIQPAPKMTIGGKKSNKTIRKPT